MLKISPRGQNIGRTIYRCQLDNYLGAVIPFARTPTIVLPPTKTTPKATLCTIPQKQIRTRSIVTSHRPVVTTSCSAGIILPKCFRSRGYNSSASVASKPGSKADDGSGNLQEGQRQSPLSSVNNMTRRRKNSKKTTLSK